MALVRGLETHKDRDEFGDCLWDALSVLERAYEERLEAEGIDIAEHDYLNDLNDDPKAVARRLARIGKGIPK